nr:class D beta-lactamase [Spirulina subsalsa]
MNSLLITALFLLSTPSHPGLMGELPVQLEVKTPQYLSQTSQSINFERHFQDLNVEGSILIYDSQNNRRFEHNPQRNTTPFPTASTFKILNSLIALETGVIADDLALLTWDGIERTLPQWNRDLNLREAFKISGVWFYQVLARRVGYERMRNWINQVEYGNQNIGRPEDIDQFWLEGQLQVTPQQQVDFLQRFYNNQLPFSSRSVSLVKDIMIMEKTPAYTLSGKTGWFGFGNPNVINIGWYVGYLETSDNVYFFATNIEMKEQQDAAARLELTRRCLQDLGAF